VKDEVGALLEVQTDDLRIYGLEDRLNALAPRLAALEGDRARAEESLAKAKQQVAEEEKRLREVQDRLRQHRELRDKSEALLNQVTAPREAAAAMAQIEQAKRFVADEEQEIEKLGVRLTELRRMVGERESAVAETGKAQQEARTSLDADRAVVERELGTVRAGREAKAVKVPRALLQKYDRIRSRRRSAALFALRGKSCANCDTAIPVQRYSTMVSSGATELCEGCGVLLYAAES
jgi:predicted  nucleic acid-binding Zn-ribbon protein